MRFYTPEESQPLMDLWGAATSEFTVRGGISKSVNRGFVSASAFLLALQPWDQCLLLVGDHDIWTSNLHLAQRLRQSYGEQRLIDEANGHLFLPFEDADLVSFMDVAISSGWDFQVVTNLGYAKLMVSHDEWFEVSFSTAKGRDEWIPIARSRNLIA